MHCIYVHYECMNTEVINDKYYVHTYVPSITKNMHAPNKLIAIC